MKRCVFLLLLLCLFSTDLSAKEERYLTFDFSEKLLYSDNVAFSAHKQDSDFYTVSSPDLYLNAKSEKLAVYGKFGVDVYEYFSENDLDDVYYDATLDFDYVLSERAMVSLSGSSVFDTTLDTMLTQTGIVRRQEDRRKYNVSPSFTYSLSERTTLVASFEWFRTEYDFPWYVDYDGKTVELDLRHALSDRNTVELISYYTTIESDASEIDAYGVLGGFEREVTERFTLTALLGLRYTDIDYRDHVFTPHGLKFYGEKHNDDDWSLLLNLGSDYKFETGRFRLGALRRVVYSTYGESVDTLRLYGSVYKNLSKRLSCYVEANYYNANSDNRVRKEDSDYYDVFFIVSYRLKEKYKVGIGYRYSDYEDHFVDTSYDRNQVWVFFTLTWGKPIAEVPEVLAH